MSLEVVQEETIEDVNDAEMQGYDSEVTSDVDREEQVIQFLEGKLENMSRNGKNSRGKENISNNTKNGDENDDMEL